VIGESGFGGVAGYCVFNLFAKLIAVTKMPFASNRF
jgi:hypothetical protein